LKNGLVEPFKADSGTSISIKIYVMGYTHNPFMLMLKECYKEVRSKFNDKLTPYGFMYSLYSDELGIRPEKNKGKDMREDVDEQYLVITDPEVEAPLNQILFGPPGTGKTYITTEMAVKLADPAWYENKYHDLDWNEFHAEVKVRYDELVQQERIVFTTFHQSFSYEDFIEGIRADTNDETNSLEYRIEDGVFKRICDNADKKVIRNEGLGEQDISTRRFWKMSLGNTQTEEGEELFADCIENNYVLLGWGGDVDFSGCSNLFEVRKKYENGYPDEKREFAFSVVNTFKNKIKKGDIIIVSSGNSRYQAITEVTGDYQKLNDEDREWFFQSRAVRWLKVYEKPCPVGEIYNSNFTQKTIYGLKSGKLKFDALSEILSTDQSTYTPLPYVLIIDEINRGNISRIFGELITLLEQDKRKGGGDERTVILPYSKKSFQVPRNVYVIGTMNTADKSLAQLDLALRRRFSFIETPPNAELLRGVSVHDIDMADMLDTMNQRIEVLLDQDHLIGHAYLLPLKELTDKSERIECLEQIFQNNIIPLLQEYFFDDWERIHWVLNDHRKKNKEHQFILNGGNTKLEMLFGSDLQEHLTERRFKVNTKAFNEPSAYQGILKGAEV
jgi:5-methylcytosine-specific restriction protein B